MQPKSSSDPIQDLYVERAGLPPLLALLQRFMTTLPGLDEAPPETGPVRLFLRDLGLLVVFAGLAGLLGALASQGGWLLWALLPAAYLSLAAAGRLRKFTVGHMHEATHGVGFDGWRKLGLSRRQVRRLRFWLAEICSVLSLTISAVRYMRAHGGHHAQRKLGTIYEADGADLADDGFVRGLPVGSFYRRLASKLLNPLWYVRKTMRRLGLSLGEGILVRRGGAALMWIAIIGSLAALPPLSWIMAVGLPWLVLYPAASLVQVITEHPYGDKKGAQDLDEYAARTWDRIPWDATPVPGASVLQAIGAWAYWILGFAFMHLPARLAVLDTTMVWHRWHHLAWPLGRAFDSWWLIAYQARQAWIDKVLPAGWQANTLKGLPDALARQKRHMETPED